MKFRSGCPVASSLEIVGDRWSLVLVRSMMLGAATYGDFLGLPEKISTNILAERLARLEAAGVIRRLPTPGRSRWRYELTPAGADLVPVAQALARWGEKHLPDRWTPPARWYAAQPSDFGARS